MLKRNYASETPLEYINGIELMSLRHTVGSYGLAEIVITARTKSISGGLP